MIEIPLGKALVPVDSKVDCERCDFMGLDKYCLYPDTVYEGSHRKDGKNVIFKLVDYPAKGE
jgi:hypothetical protein